MKPRPWMSCCWSSRCFQLQGRTRTANRLSSMLTASTIPLCTFCTQICSIFIRNWRSGWPRTCQKSWIWQTPAMSGALKPWTIFLFTAWFQTDGAITCTPFNASSLNPICIKGLCGRGVFLSKWKSIASMARTWMLRWVDIQSICNLSIIIYHYMKRIPFLTSAYTMHIVLIVMVYSNFVFVLYHICCKYILGI